MSSTDAIPQARPGLLYKIPALRSAVRASVALLLETDKSLDTGYVCPVYVPPFIDLVYIRPDDILIEGREGGPLMFPYFSSVIVRPAVRARVALSLLKASVGELDLSAVADLRAASRPVEDDSALQTLSADWQQMVQHLAPAPLNEEGPAPNGHS